MKVAAVVKFKHGGLWNALKAAGWNQAELARRANISPNSICDYCSLKCRPSDKTAAKIQLAFAEAEVYIDVLEGWPPEFKGLPISQMSSVSDVGIDRLLYTQQLHELPEHVDPQAEGLIKHALSTLTDRERAVIEGRFYERKYLEDLAKEFNVTRERIRQIESKAMRKLRHPVRSDALRGLLPGGVK